VRLSPPMERREVKADGERWLCGGRLFRACPLWCALWGAPWLPEGCHGRVGGCLCPTGYASFELPSSVGTVRPALRCVFTRSAGACTGAWGRVGVVRVCDGACMVHPPVECAAGAGGPLWRCGNGDGSATSHQGSRASPPSLIATPVSTAVPLAYRYPHPRPHLGIIRP
jgi:hypothetical protein